MKKFFLFPFFFILLVTGCSDNPASPADSNFSRMKLLMRVNRSYSIVKAEYIKIVENEQSFLHFDRIVDPDSLTKITILSDSSYGIKKSFIDSSRDIMPFDFLSGTWSLSDQNRKLTLSGFNQGKTSEVKAVYNNGFIIRADINGQLQELAIAEFYYF